MSEQQPADALESALLVERFQHGPRAAAPITVARIDRALGLTAAQGLALDAMEHERMMPLTPDDLRRLP